VATIGGLSGHAGQDLLVEYAQAAGGNMKRVFLTHGEPKSAEALQEKLAKVGIRQVRYPEWNTAEELE
jgi:predicted metal-dependent RNase